MLVLTLSLWTFLCSTLSKKQHFKLLPNYTNTHAGTSVVLFKSLSQNTVHSSSTPQCSSLRRLTRFNCVLHPAWHYDPGREKIFYLCTNVWVSISLDASVCLSVYLSQCSRCVSCLSLYLSVVLSRGVSLHCNGLFFYLCLLAPEEWIYLLTNGSHPSRFSTGNNMTQLCSAVCKSHHPAFSNIWWHM